jgi:chromate transport protein ChrA
LDNFPRQTEDAARQRAWLTEDKLLDRLGAWHLIPGPSTNEMAIHIGLRRTGRAERRRFDDAAIVSAT